MKTTILILVLFIFSFSIGSTETSEDVALEDANVEYSIRIRHYLGSENGPNQYIEIEAPYSAWAGHVMHPEDCYLVLSCEPPLCGCRR
jgi:hypothetical protein